ncbi:hypothetical protein SAMN05216497_1039 [Clostridium cochlearium]|uniref:Uncharacterized protein n=1 Tax=Clostridium cochlearium TaxID=1494 RepID=A0ABY0QJ64_CLOCO|nr:hypothetical protein SAMN05216497_1039 [Clostridium cochlearium]
MEKVSDNKYCIFGQIYTLKTEVKLKILGGILCLNQTKGIYLYC